MVSYLIGIGTNERRLVNLRSSCQLLSEVGTVTQRSWVYESAAIGQDAPAFWNSMLELHTALSHDILKQRLQAIEDMMQRVRHLPDGSKNPIVTLDLDILAMDDVVLSDALFAQPHCVVPLADIAPQRTDPITRQSAQALADKVRQQVVRVTDSHLKSSYL